MKLILRKSETRQMGTALLVTLAIGVWIVTAWQICVRKSWQAKFTYLVFNSIFGAAAILFLTSDESTLTARDALVGRTDNWMERLVSDNDTNTYKEESKATTVASEEKEEPKLKAVEKAILQKIVWHEGEKKVTFPPLEEQNWVIQYEEDGKEVIKRVEGTEFTYEGDELKNVFVYIEVLEDGKSVPQNLWTRVRPKPKPKSSEPPSSV